MQLQPRGYKDLIIHHAWRHGVVKLWSCASNFYGVLLCLTPTLGLMTWPEGWFTVDIRSSIQSLVQSLDQAIKFMYASRVSNVMLFQRPPCPPDPSPKQMADSIPSALTAGRRHRNLWREAYQATIKRSRSIYYLWQLLLLVLVICRIRVQNVARLTREQQI